ncbi:MAG: hypothetical protein ABMA00_22065, partial [Gemmatimonas sp.]
MRSRCAESPAVDALMEQSVIQFWCIGARLQVGDGITWWPETPSLTEVANKLARARSAQVSAAFPDLGVRDVLVLERISLFDADVREHRVALRGVMDTVPDLQQQSTLGQQGFRYRWIALADVVHDPTRVSSQERAEARAASLATSKDTLTFLVDRQDSAVAVIDETLASRCLTELAMAFLHGDLGAPRRDATLALPSVISDVGVGQFVPFGVAVLEHTWREIDMARVSAFKRRLALGVTDRGSVDAALEPSHTLLDALNADCRLLDAGQYDRHARRRARDESLQAALSWIFAEGDVRWMRGRLTELQRGVAQLTLPGAGADRLYTPALISAVALQDVPAGSPGSRLATTGLVVALGAAVAALVLFRRQRQSRNRSATAVGEELEQRTTPSMREDARREWEQLCAHLSSLLDAWDGDCRAARALGRDAASTDPLWSTSPPIGRRLTASLPVLEDEIAVTPELCRDVARHAVALLDGRTSAEDVIMAACRRELQRWDDRLRGGAAPVSEYL